MHDHVRIPFVDLRLQDDEIAAEVREGWDRVIADSAFVLSEVMRDFERDYAHYCGAAHCVAVANGTDALELALRAVGVGPGDEVVVPAMTFVATAHAVLRAGAVPVLVDVDPDHLLIDAGQVADGSWSQARAVVPVHLYGQLAPMRDLRKVADERGLAVVEDAAQAHGATGEGDQPGAGGVAATSFYPSKNLGAYGDAGAVVTDDQAVADRVRSLRDHGTAARYEHPDIGFNSRLDGLQAVVLLAKLRRLDAWNEQRRQAAARYDELLADVAGVVAPTVRPGNVHVWHLYTVRVDRRDEVLGLLTEAGVQAAVHYPTPLHLHGSMRFLGHGPGAFPNSEAAARELLSLPLFPGITADQQDRVVSALVDALR
jgi:dTDP-4-amino-4,6-dideoxygalactose transaminase